jgi:transcriptional regulator with XRE-family HTH domain
VGKRDKKYELAFGRNIRKLRDERFWSQAQLGSLTNMSNQQISTIERGKHAVTLHTIKALAIALGKYPDELLRFEYEIKLNTDFGPNTRKKERPKTTDTIIKLVDTGFLNSPKSVGEINAECQKQFKLKLPSSAVSGILKKFVSTRLLKRLPSPHKSGTFLYQKR